MNFMEQLFGFAPDAGNGSTEALLFALLTLIVVSRVTSVQRLVHRLLIGGR